jgi:hypothetical protein
MAARSASQRKLKSMNEKWGIFFKVQRFRVQGCGKRVAGLRRDAGATAPQTVYGLHIARFES